MQSFRKHGMSLLVAVAGIVAVATAAESPRLDVQSEATVAGDTIVLRDIATLQGTAAEALGDVVVGRSANAGESRTFDGGYVLGALRRAGLDPAVVTYAIPPMIRVRRPGQSLDAIALRPVIERWLDTTLGAGARDAELRSVELSSPVLVPLGAWDARVVTAPRDSVSGTVRLQLEISAGERAPRMVWVTADVARWVPVVVARRALERGEIIAPSDVELDRRELSTLPRDISTSLDDVVGAAVRQAVVPFSPLRRDQLASVPVVRRGDAVQIVAQHGGLRLTAAGEVRQDGGRGDQVRVINRASQRELLARVVNGTTVEVGF